MSLKKIEQGILAGDWAKVIKAYNAITGAKLKAPTIKGVKVKPIKVTKTKVVEKVVYKTDPNIENALEFYSNKTNYGVVGSAIPILMDGGEKARFANTLKVETSQEPEPEPKTPKTTKEKKSKGKKAANKSVIDDGGVTVIDLDEFNESKAYMKNAIKKQKVHREPDTSRDIIPFSCTRCGRQKMFRRFETEKSIHGERMDVICNSCIAGG